MALEKSCSMLSPVVEEQLEPSQTLGGSLLEPEATTEALISRPE